MDGTLFLPGYPVTVILSPDSERRSGPSSRSQMGRTGQLAVPGANLALIVGHVEIHDAVRIGPVKIGHGSLERDFRLRIERGVSVVRIGSNLR